MNFQRALDFVLEREGGYVNDPDDPGGATNHGITQRTFSGWLADHDMEDADVRDVVQEEVWYIYRERYWKRGRCDRLPEYIQLPHFDACVNHGTSRAGMLLQRALNRLGNSLAVDGIVGPKTLTAMVGELGLRETLLWERLRFYRTIVAQRTQSLKFLPQWIRRLEHLNDYNESGTILTQGELIQC